MPQPVIPTVPGPLNRLQHEHRPFFEKVKDGKILYYAEVLPTSWTTIYLVPARTTPELTWLSVMSTDADAKTVQLRAQEPSSTLSPELCQCQLTADGMFWIPLKDVRKLVLEPGWKLQMISSDSGGSVFLCGWEWGVP